MYVSCLDLRRVSHLTVDSRKPCTEMARGLFQDANLRSIPLSTPLCCCCVDHIYRCVIKLTCTRLTGSCHSFRVGSMLSLFLGRNCGPREGAIRLPPEKPDDDRHDEVESRPVTPVPEESEERGLMRRVSKKLSGYFARRVHDAHEESTSGPSEPPVPLSSPGRNRTFSRTSRVTGSAYGYTGGYRNRLASNVTLGTRRGSMASASVRRRRESNMEGAPSSVATGSDLNFAQRLLMANENAVNNIADLWVAAAMNVDNEDPFESESDIDAEEAIDEEDELQEADMFAQTPTPSHVNRFLRRASTNASQSSFGRSPRRPSMLGSHRTSSQQRRLSSSHPADEEAPLSPRRYSTNTAPICSVY